MLGFQSTHYLEGAECPLRFFVLRHSEVHGHKIFLTELIQLLFLPSHAKLSSCITHSRSVSEKSAMKINFNNKAVVSIQ